MATPSLPDPLPDLPYLDAAIALDVYAHSSLHYVGKPINEEYGDNERLAILGETVLSMAVTQSLFYKKPLKSAAAIAVRLSFEADFVGWIVIALCFYCYFLMLIQEERQLVTSDANIHIWVEAYKMKSRLAFAPSALEATKTETVSHLPRPHTASPDTHSRLLVSSWHPTSVQSTTDTVFPQSGPG